jgi:hypothetical protein
MTLDELHRAFSLLDHTKADFAGAVSEQLIDSAEKSLGLEFPRTYREFLGRLGCGAVRANEFYGLIPDRFDHSGVPDTVWLTLKSRQANEIPESYIVVGETGYGPIYAIDVAQRNADGESPVVEWMPGLDADAEGNGRTIASDFGRFFLELVQEALDE